MPFCRSAIVAGVGLVGSLLFVDVALAQGVSTGTIQGTVRTADGAWVDGALVEVRNVVSGYAIEVSTGGGRFVVPGLYAGGAYSVTVRHEGFADARFDGLAVHLGEPLELDVVLQPIGLRLEPLTVDVDAAVTPPGVAGGTAMLVSEALVRDLPSLDRDFYDFVRLVPQVSTRIGFPSGLSGGGVGFRYNSFLINGVSERTLFANATPALGGGKSLPLAAVQEYQVLIAPYDVRYGDFAGALVNTITRSGTNEFEGSAFAYTRNDHLANVGDLSPGSYDLWQYGFAVGGPVARDRLHFFVAPEFQRLTEPASGPYVGQPATRTPRVPVDADVLQSADEILREWDLVPGSAGPVDNVSPLVNVYSRLDLALPEAASRIALWHNHTGNDRENFSRDEAGVFPLSTLQVGQDLSSDLVALQLQTVLGRAGGGSNELLLHYKSEAALGSSDVRQPLVDVLVPGVGGGLYTLRTGTNELAQGGDIHASTFAVSNTLTLALGEQVVTLGASAERFRLDQGGVIGSFGSWSFSSLDSLRAGTPARYEIRRATGSGDPELRGGQYALYAGAERVLGERFRLTLGLRLDWLAFDGAAPYNADVDSIFGRRTDRVPDAGPWLSPRLGFSWDVSERGRDRVRGGVGLFGGRPPLAWIYAAQSRYGIGVGALRCGAGALDAGPPPSFEPDPSRAPTACANGASLSASPRGDVDLLDAELGLVRTLRTSLAYDRELATGLRATAELLVTRNVSDLMFTNLNLAGPAGADLNGRVLYGTIDTSGVATPNLRSSFAEVIDLAPTDRNNSWQLAVRLDGRLSSRLTTLASYTMTRARDVQTPLRTGSRGTVNWASRAVSGLHDDAATAVSLNDVPHRVALAMTYASRSPRWRTSVALYWIGESGSPFTYVAWGAGRRGDLNADGSNVNDPIYVPADVFDPDEIRFSGRSELPGADNSPAAQASRAAAQRRAFAEFVATTPCLRARQGRILERNGCREPWSNTTVLSVRQAIPVGSGALEAELDLFNALNLLDRDAGLRQLAVPALLEHVGQTSEAPAASHPIFRYDPGRPRWALDALESSYQLQLGLRYRF